MEFAHFILNPEPFDVVSTEVVKPIEKKQDRPLLEHDFKSLKNEYLNNKLVRDILVFSKYELLKPQNPI